MQPIEVDEQTAQRLAAQAEAHGITVAQYVDSLVPPLSVGNDQSGLAAELDLELETLALELPILPREFSRTDR